MNIFELYRHRLNNTQSMGQSGFEKASTAVTANYEMKRA
jgi:hypothetical protein